jgi:DNA-directed RNA polymerase subunit M/transcription elongation factor TFIIS
MEGIELYNEMIAKYPQAKEYLYDPLKLVEKFYTKNTDNKTICKFCNKKEVFEYSAQLRSSDEGETLLKICSRCGKSN